MSSECEDDPKLGEMTTGRLRDALKSCFDKVLDGKQLVTKSDLESLTAKIDVIATQNETILKELGSLRERIQGLDSKQQRDRSSSPDEISDLLRDDSQPGKPPEPENCGSTPSGKPLLSAKEYERMKARRKLKKLRRREREKQERKAKKKPPQPAEEKTEEEKLKEALKKESEAIKEGERLQKLDDRKRNYNSMVEVAKPTDIEMEAYMMKKRRDEDPMAQFL